MLGFLFHSTKQSCKETIDAFIKFHSTAIYRQQTMEGFARERALPDPGAVKTSPCCQTIGSNYHMQDLGLGVCSPSADGNVTAWTCRSVFRSCRQCQAAGGYIVLKNVMNLLQCKGITRSMPGVMATYRNCVSSGTGH